MYGIKMTQRGRLRQSCWLAS